MEDIIFTNLVDTPEKAASIASTYAPNNGSKYDLSATLENGSSFYDRNLEHILGALALLQGK